MLVNVVLARVLQQLICAGIFKRCLHIFDLLHILRRIAHSRMGDPFGMHKFHQSFSFCLQNLVLKVNIWREDIFFIVPASIDRGYIEFTKKLFTLFFLAGMIILQVVLKWGVR